MWSKKDEAEYEVARLIDRNVAAIADARVEVEKARFEVLAAVPRVVGCGFLIGPEVPRRRRRVRRVHAAAVVALHAAEVQIRRLHQLGARHPAPTSAGSARSARFAYLSTSSTSLLTFQLCTLNFQLSVIVYRGREATTSCKGSSAST
jgi:hypothetical protein